MGEPIALPEGWKLREMKGIPASMEALCTRKTEQGFHYALQTDERHANVQGIVHGGVLMSLMDHGLSLVIWEATDRALCSTVHLDNHFLAAVRPPAFVELDATITRQGKKLVFARGVLRVGEEAVMEATGVWSIARPDA